MNRICTLDGVRLNPHKEWSANGVDHPSGVWPKYTDEQLRSFGVEVTYETPQTKKDPWDWRELEDRSEFEEDGVTPLLDEDGEQIITQGLKSDAIARVKQQQAERLGAIQWQYDREDRYGTPVPVETRALDQAIRRAGDTMEAAIVACTSKDELKALNTNTEESIGTLNQWPDPKNLPAYTPDQVTRLQARVVLRQAGLIETIEANLTDPVALEYWHNAQVFKRNSPFIDNMKSVIKKTDAEIDALFVAALEVE